jgi:hypothetical protein
MTNLHDDAITLLHYMLDEGLVAPKGISPRELQDVLRISDNEFDSAENFLLQSHLVEGAGGQDGVRWMTPGGVHFISEELQGREPLTFDAERVLRFLVQEINDNDFLTQDKILKGVNISVERYHQACQQLADFDFATIFGFSNDKFPSLIPTKLGRQVVHRNFRRPVPSPNIQAGAIFNAPVNGGNIQAIASAIGSEIRQNVSTLAPDELNKEIEKTLDKLLEQITEYLTLQQKATYTQIAAELQREVSQPQPDPSKLHKLLAGLGLFSDLGGAIDLSQKTFELVVKASPYVMLLAQLIIQLLQNASR